MTYSRQKQVPLYVAEKGFFGMDHCEFGFQIASQWKLNPSLSAAIKYHHNINEAPEEFKQFVATIALANIVTNKSEIGFSGDKFPDSKEKEIFEITSLSWDNVDSAEEQAGDAIKKAEVLLSI